MRFKKLPLIMLAVLAVLAFGLAGFALAAKPVASTALAADVAAKADKFTAATKTEIAQQAEGAKVRVKKPTDRPLRVLFAGDSLTYGLYTSAENKGFRPLVVAGLSATMAVEETKAQFSGAGVNQVSNLVSAPENLDLAIIELGTNDVPKTDLGAFRDQYAALITKIRTPSPGAALLCVGTWSPGDAQTLPFNYAIKDACVKNGGQYVDVLDLYNAAGNHGAEGVKTWAGVSDTFHPNDAGHKAIADLILSRIALV